MYLKSRNIHKEKRKYILAGGYHPRVPCRGVGRRAFGLQCGFVCYVCIACERLILVLEGKRLPNRRTTIRIGRMPFEGPAQGEMGE